MKEEEYSRWKEKGVLSDQSMCKGTADGKAEDGRQWPSQPSVNRGCRCGFEPRVLGSNLRALAAGRFAARADSLEASLLAAYASDWRGGPVQKASGLTCLPDQIDRALKSRAVILAHKKAPC